MYDCSYFMSRDDLVAYMYFISGDELVACVVYFIFCVDLHISIVLLPKLIFEFIIIKHRSSKWQHHLPANPGGKPGGWPDPDLQRWLPVWPSLLCTIRSH